MIIKQKRDKKRKEYHEYLNKKGRITKQEAKITRKQGGSYCSSVGNSGVGKSFGSNSIDRSSNGGSAWTTNAFVNNGIYLKPTQIGFDAWSSIGIYPWADFSGTNEEYNKILYIEIRMGINTVYDVSSFEPAWESATPIYSEGFESNWTDEYFYGNYKHFTPILTDGYSYQQLIKIKFANSDKSSAAVWYFWSEQVYLQTLSSPAVSFNQSTNNFTISGATSDTFRAIEFNRDNYDPYGDFLTKEETDICYNCSVRDQEFGLYYGQVQPAFDFALWDVGNYSVKVSYAAGHPIGTRSRFNNAVNNWIAQMNSTIEGSGTSFYRDDSDSTPSILVETKSNSNMGSNETHIYAGLWQNETNEDGWIDSAWIRLNYETSYYDNRFTTVEAVTTEELYEACGCGGDLRTRADCINTDFNWVGKGDGNFNTIDSHIMSFLYKSDIYLAVGGDSTLLAVMMNPSNGFNYTSTNTEDAYWLEENVTYNMRVWQANYNNHYSVVPDYSNTFTPTNYPQIPSIPSLNSITPRVETGLNIQWSSGTNANYYKLRYKLSGGSYSYIDNINSTSYQLTGLAYGTSYYVSVSSRSNVNKPSSSYSDDNLLTTAPKIPTISENSHTETSITINLNVSLGNYDYVKIWYKTSSGSWDSVQVENGFTQVLISGLVVNTTYEIKASSFYNNIESVSYNGSIGYSSSIYVTTGKPRPSNWSWSYNISSDQNVLNFNSTTKTIYLFTATEWNYFTEKINQFRQYKNLSNFNFTNVSSETNFTKEIVNEAWDAINALNVQNLLPRRVAGDNILQALIYQNLRDCLNSVI